MNIYNIHYDISACIIILFSIGIHIYRKKLSIPQNFFFFLLLIFSFFSAFFDFLRGLSSSFYDQYPTSYHWVVNCVYFILMELVCHIYTVYCYSVCNQFYRVKVTKKLLYITGPFYVGFFAVVSSPWTGFVFKILNSGECVRSRGVILVYLVNSYYWLFSLYILFRGRKNLSSKKQFCVYTFLTFPIVGFVLQFFKPYILITPFLEAMCILLMLISAQKQEDNIDFATDMFNQSAFLLMAERNFENKRNFKVFSVVVDDVPFLDNTFGIKNINKLLHDIGLLLDDYKINSSFAMGAEKSVKKFLRRLVPKLKTRDVFHIRRGIFCMLFDESEEEEFETCMEVLYESFLSSWKIDLVEVKISARICCIDCPKDAEKTETILDILRLVADHDQYKHEKLIYPYMIDMSQHNRQSFVENAVKYAIQENRVSVRYQPLYSVKDKRIVGAEALIRLQGLDGVPISPDEFIPIAEQNGMILRIGQYVFESVCRFFALNKLESLGVKMIDINLSVVQCMQHTLALQIIEMVQNYHLSPQNLNLEITETAAIHSPGTLLENMKELRKNGFSFSLDDYGSGYANINYVINLPFSNIKIDKEIVQSMFTDQKASIILKSTCEMMKKLGLEIIAEGVETAEMVLALGELGCDYLQGFYFEKPLTEEEFLALLCRQQATGTIYPLM